MPKENIATEERAMTITAEVKANAPILGLMNSDLKSEFGAESGDTISALIPGFGQVNEGMALPENTSDYALSIQKVPIQVTPKNMPVSYDYVDNSVRIGSFDEKVAIPYGAHLASRVRSEAFSKVIGGATHAFVLDKLADLKFAVLAEVIAAIKDSNMGGKIGGAMSNIMKATLTSGGLAQFLPSQVAFDLWKGKIQNFEDTEFVSQSEVVKLKSPAAITGGKVSGAVAEGADTISVKFDGISSVTAIPAGYVFHVKGVNSVDIFKKDTGGKRAFVVLPNSSTSEKGDIVYSNPLTDASGNVALKILPVYASNPALKNAAALPAAGADIELALVSGQSYQTGAIWDGAACAYASAAIKEAPGTDSSTSSIEGFVNARMTAAYDIKAGVNIVRFDILTGGKPLYGQGIAGLWVPI
jgi:hypothetical protein